jgi:hypothetical protein
MLVLHRVSVNFLAFELLLRVVVFLLLLGEFLLAALMPSGWCTRARWLMRVVSAQLLAIITQF